MRYNVVIFGSLYFKRGRAKAWRKKRVDSKGDKQIVRAFPKKKHWPPTDVETLLAELPRMGGHDLFQVHEDGGMVDVRGLFTDVAFDARCRQLAALFICAADLGAEGHICFLGEGVAVGYGISVAEGEAELIALTEDQITNASLHPALDAVSDHFKSSPGRDGGGPTVVPALRRGPKPELLRIPRGVAGA